MLDPPRQDWTLYRQLTEPYENEWQRKLTPSQRFEIYQDLYRIATARTGPGDWDKLDEWRWKEKVARRLKEVEAFRKLDELLRERAAENHSD